MASVDPEREPRAEAQQESGVLRVELEMEIRSDPIRGCLRIGDRSEAFVGWLALAHALGRLHERANADACYDG